MKLIKLSFVFLVFALLVFASLNVFANPNQRSLPTIYKVTGNIDVESSGNNYYFLTAYVKHSGNNYAVGKSNCLQFNNFKNTLSEGVFIGPIPSSLLPNSEKTFDLHLSVKQYSSSSSCQNAHGAINIEIGETFPNQVNT